MGLWVQLPELVFISNSTSLRLGDNGNGQMMYIEFSPSSVNLVWLSNVLC